VQNAQAARNEGQGERDKLSLISEGQQKQVGVLGPESTVKLRQFELMLDTIDTAPYLENKDPGRFAGSRQALRDWLRRLRESFPRAVVIANGGAALVDAAPFVDGFVVEGVFSIYDPGRKVYRATTDAERTWKLGAIARARDVARKPVFSIEYADVGDVALSRWAFQESVRHGFRPYVGVRDLNTAP